jgi:hypothetical protein
VSSRVRTGTPFVPEEIIAFPPRTGVFALAIRCASRRSHRSVRAVFVTRRCAVRCAGVYFVARIDAAVPVR